MLRLSLCMFVVKVLFVFLTTPKEKERPQKLLELLTAASTSSDLHLVIEGLPRGQRQSVHIAVSMLHRQGKRVQSKSIKEEDGVEVNQLHLWMQKSGEAEDQNVELQDVEQEVCIWSALVSSS